MRRERSTSKTLAFLAVISYGCATVESGVDTAVDTTTAMVDKTVDTTTAIVGKTVDTTLETVDRLKDHATIEMTNDGTVHRPGEDPRPVKAGETIPLADKPLFLEAPGRVGLLIIPKVEGLGAIKAELRPIKNWGGAHFEEKSELVLNEIVAAIVEIQTQLGSNRPQDAYEKLEQLHRKYPSLDYINFLKASALFLLGRKDASVEALTLGLSKYPDDKQGRELYKVLTNKEFAK